MGELADQLPVSRPAVSQHLRLLHTAEVVSCRKEGTRSVYSVRPESLAELRDELERMWERALARYALVANNTNRRKT